jgi:hypothetical protein
MSARATLDASPAMNARTIRRRHILAAIALTGAAVLLLLGAPDHDSVPKARARAQSMTPLVVSITLASGERARAVPSAFLGLSTEYWAAQTFERRPALFARVLRLLHVPGDNPEVLRIGGDSADHSFYEPDVRTQPPWMFAITPRWLLNTSALLRRADARVMLDLNLVTGSPLLAARWASAAYRGLPRETLAGFEIGNEPDIYSRSDWLAIVGRDSPWAGALPARLSAQAYDLEYDGYARAVGAVAPGVPLSGPVLANPNSHQDWISSLLAADRGAVASVTGHRYPLSACAKPHSPMFPTVVRVLAERASAGNAQLTARGVEIAHRAGLRFRLSELNSVTCGGRPGVSDTFATALWAPDALFELMRVGVDAVDVHVRDDAINAAFTLGASGLGARPLLYGLILFTRTLGAHARLIPLRLHAGRMTHLKAWAVLAPDDRLKVLLVNKGDQPVLARLRLPATDPASVQRLLAPSAASHTGELLDGQRLGAGGQWVGRRIVQPIFGQAGRYAVPIPRSSAALVSVQVRSANPG